ncbi:msl8599 [Mesorhizobium japonicum MAFF 303099]|uniref:Msl8599 protein n=1 Tax=Mesorhizobium japonicum (strain LMG 29417 / CECT 9101 / MAFF 303099) TaxID=266835 RepID=Q98L55_RHILO|nr:msl8599 [Mesorhizobium japonicum MAFF 303099]
MRRSSLRFSFRIVFRARMIRGPVASIRGGPSGADRGAAKRAPEAEAALAGDAAP